MFFKKKNRTKKVMVIGLDGVPYSLLNKLIGDDVTPNIKRIAKRANLSRMQVVHPEISQVSWSSFMTGVNPGRHGMMGFVDVDRQTYKLTFPNFSDLKAPTIFDLIAQKGKRPVVINQPATYPARPIEGVLISGFVAIDMFKAVYPSKYLGPLRRLNYAIDIDMEKGRKDPDFLFSELERSLETRSAACHMLIDNEQWDYFQVVVTGTDRLMHFHMDAIEDSSLKLHGRAMEYFNKVDTFVGRLFDRFCQITDSDGDGFMLLSDHGFTTITSEFYLSKWLEENGYLSFESDQKTLSNISDSAKAFAIDPGRIFLHRKDAFPKGCVDDQEAAQLVKKIRAELKELTFEGRPVFRDLFEPTEIYSGPFVDQAADLIGWCYDGFDVKATLNSETIFGRSELTGMHTQHDAFLCTRDSFEGSVHITDVAKKILARF